MGGTHPRSRQGVPHPRSEWGYPVPGPDGGYPIPGLDGGYPIPGPDGGGYPIPGPDRRYPILLMGECPHPRSGWGSIQGYPLLSRTGWCNPPPISKASTCYAAGGVPLAFTQENFLVVCCLWFYSSHVLNNSSR